MNTVVRDHAELVSMIRGGSTGALVARHYGISRERVRQIWTKRTGERLPNVPEQACQTCGAQGRRIRDSSEHNRSERHRDAITQRKVNRFWRSVDRDGPVPAYAPALGRCWLWTGHTYPTGYGSSHLFGQGYAHRIAYALTYGPIAGRLTIDHLCRVRGCVNPGHLEAVSQRENTLRSPFARAAINARKTHCLRGHEFTVANTRISTDGRNRACRACARIRNGKAYRERRAA